MKKIFIFILIVVIAIFSYVFIKNTTFAPELSVLPIVLETESTDYIDFKLSKPQIPSGKYLEMDSFLKESKDSFNNEYGNISEEDAELWGLGGERKYSYYVDTKTATSSDTVSYMIQVYTYTGGAHGIASVSTFTYDAKNKLINLDDLFNDPNYLGVVSEKAADYFIDKLGENGDPSVIREGTAPVFSNYSSWYLTDDEIVFIFGQYSIGPYVLGIQEFPLKKEDVKDLLNSKYID